MAAQHRGKDEPRLTLTFIPTDASDDELEAFIAALQESPVVGDNWGTTRQPERDAEQPPAEDEQRQPSP